MTMRRSLRENYYMSALKEALLLISHSLTGREIAEIECMILNDSVTIEEILVKFESVQLENS